MNNMLKGCAVPEIFRAVWTAIDTIVRGGVEKVESALAILGPHEFSYNSVINLSISEYMDVSQADVIIRTSAHVGFPVHEVTLATSSSAFNHIFSLAQPSNETVDVLPIVQLSEGAGLVPVLITALYLIPFETVAHRVLPNFGSARRFSEIGIPCVYHYEQQLNRLIPEMEMVARLSLGLPMTFEYFGVELRLLEGCALHALVEFRILHMNDLNSCFRLLPRRTGPSNICVDCPGLRRRPYTLKSPLKNSLGTSDSLAPRDKPGGGGSGTQSLPAWLHNVLREEMGGWSRAFKSPLIGPLDIRAKYMSALQKHVTTDRCAFCPGVHTLEGEKYIPELERALTQTRNRTTLEFSNSGKNPRGAGSASEKSKYG
ncbi:hypothetical protein EDB86DRAFT_3216440 [Lactarius hatsudake]|nr:hypothetical protein EDB86DRAFT_3216440 [Lactarius hatsudake]